MDKKCESCVNEPKPAYYVYATPSRDVNYICKACAKTSFFRRWHQEVHLQPLVGKEVRRYNLSLDHKYTLLGIEYLGSLLDGGGSSCENCGKLIVNIATVKTEEGKTYGIGTDCAETLSFVDRSDFWKLKEAEALYFKMLGWVRKVKQAQKEGKKVTGGYDNTYKCWIVYYNGNWQFRLTEKTYQAYFKKII